MSKSREWECCGVTVDGKPRSYQDPEGPHSPYSNFGTSCAYCRLTKEDVQGGGDNSSPPIRKGMLAAVAGIIAALSVGAIAMVFFKSPSKPVGEQPTSSLGVPSPPVSSGGSSLSGVSDRIGSGEKLLLTLESNSDGFKQQKLYGIEEMGKKQYARAVTFFNEALRQFPNAPETLIYRNNARIGEGKAYTIAVSVPITTDSAGSAEILRGVAQAQDEINQSGGVKGVPLKVVIANDDNDPVVAEQVATAFVQNPSILGVVGHYASDVTLAAGKIYNSSGLVCISAVSTSVKLSGFGKYTFRTVPSDAIAANSLADYVTKTLKVKDVAVFFNSESGYSQSLKSKFVESVLTGGGNVLREINFSDPNFNAAKEVEQTLQQGAKALMLAANTGTLDKALEVVKANKKRGILLGGDDLYSPKVLEVGRDQALEMIVAVPWHIDSNPKAPYVLRSWKLWGSQVNWRSAIAYDATKAIVAALQKEPTRQGIQKILTMSDFATPGATESIRFTPAGDRNSRIQLVKIIPGSRSGKGFDFVPLGN